MAFVFSFYISTEYLGGNKTKKTTKNEQKVEAKVNQEELIEYKKRVLQNTVRKEFEVLFDVDMESFEYSDIKETFPGKIVSQAGSLSNDLGDYYPLGFTKGDRGYILLLEHDGTSRLWTLHRQNREWKLVTKNKKQGKYIDNKKLMDKAEKGFIEKHQ